MNPGKIAQILGCEFNSKSINTDVGVSIDSRTLKSGEVYLALTGERFNGHDFIAEAIEKGASAIICEKPLEQTSVPAFVVKSSLEALSLLASWHRQQINHPVIALTGSNGKTTVKEMVASILPKPALATQGNLNNHIGVPLSILKLRPEHRYAVFELGANHPGEIRYTAAMVKPDVALINNIAPAHIEGFGSIENVAKAKGEIYESLGEGGIAVVNEDDDFAHFWDPLFSVIQPLRFSLTKPTAVHAREITFDEAGAARFRLCLPCGSGFIQLQIPGKHSIQNALAAAACSYAAGIDLSFIIEGLEAFKGVSGRLEFLQGKNQAKVINDTYNANLRSVLTAVEVLAHYKGKKILVLGDMGELGEYAKGHHEAVGRKALASGIDYLMTCGHHSAFASEAFGAKAKHYATREALAQDLLHYLDRDTTVLVKGSRGAGMENVVHQLLDWE